MADSDHKAEAALLGCGLMIVLFPFTIMLRAWVLTILWGWFFVPFGLQQIGLAWAYGLSTAIAMFTPHSIPKSSEDESIGQVALKFIGTGLIMPLLFLFIGWVCHLFM